MADGKASDEKAARLAAALRANLRRRKAQARGCPDESPPAGAADQDGSSDPAA
jgi:hypothetical protein